PGEKRLIRAGDIDAGFPIANQRPSPVSVHAMPGARLLQVSTHVLSVRQRLTPEAPWNQLDDDAPWRAHPLAQQLLQQARDGTLPLPEMPGVALRIRSTMARKDFRLDEIASILNGNPAVVARLLKVANSALFGTQTQCESARSALMRLGVEKSQSIVTSLLLRDLFGSNVPQLRSILEKRWRHVTEVAVLAATLASLAEHLQPEQVLLAGLLHEIGGLAVIRLVEKNRVLLGEPELIQAMLSALTPALSGLMLDQWGLDTGFAIAARHQNHWFREQDGPPDYADLLLLAHLHAQSADRIRLQLPRLDETPAYARLQPGRLGALGGLQMLTDARAEIQEMKALLG
ncbi:MAG TPA: HDOD domain-containing protein, partial [Dongiaceae bacterium]|nr:HDOD domain-containing protein [Dongiaceae bacterium]